MTPDREQELIRQAKDWERASRYLPHNRRPGASRKRKDRRHRLNRRRERRLLKAMAGKS